jgi:hypothetical protein
MEKEVLLMVPKSYETSKSPSLIDGSFIFN